MRQNSIIVGLFNKDNVLFPQPDTFVAEVEEEGYIFKIVENDLYIYFVDENRFEHLVKVYAMGRWAQVEYI